MRRSTLLRVFALLAISGMVAACSSAGGTASINTGGLTGPAISPLLTGLSQNQLTSYETWFRNPQGATSPFTPGPNGALSGTPVVLDPQCGLSYAYAQMASRLSGDSWSAGWDGLALDPVRVGNGANSGFFNPTTQQVLFILQGYDILGKGACGSRTPGFIPVRLDLASGRWNVEGFASPGATVQIKISTAYEMAPLKNTHEIDDSVPAYVSPLRLMRFTLTDANFTRVSDYATLSKTGPGRHIDWFRTSDLSPSYTHQATDAVVPSGTTLCLPAVAFWPAENGCGATVAGGEERDASSATMFADNFARQAPSGGGTALGGSYDVAGKNDDDVPGSTLPGDTWQKITDTLKELAQNTSYADEGPTSALASKRKDILKRLQDLLNPTDKTQGGNVPADNALPSALGGWDNTGTDVFGVLVDNGNGAYGETLNDLKDSNLPAIEPLVGFVGQPNSTGVPLHETAVVISPSMWAASANATSDAQAKFYDDHSFLFNSGTNTFNVMGFSTDDPTKIASSSDQTTISGDTPGIPYVQSPETRFEFDVANSLDTSNAAVYTSAWVPTMALWQNGPAQGIAIHYDPLFQFPQAVVQAINNLVYDIYASTVGALATTLSRAATTNLLAVPELSQYQVLYYAGDGQPVYAMNQANLKQPICQGIIGNALFDPNADGSINGVSFATVASTCLVGNGMYNLWNAVRALSLLLFIALIARYFYGLLLREKAEIKVVGFLARAFLAMGIILGMNAIIGILSRVIAETILVTDLIGTQLSGGVPYSHLWLFASYLSAPNHDMGVFLLMLLAPFMIIGFFVLLVVNWLRIVMSILLIMLSPIWVISLMADPAMRTFYSGLRTMMRLYLIPLTSLVFLLVLFLLAKTIGINAGHGADPLGAVVGMLMLIALAIVPFILSKYITAPVTAIQAMIQGALAQADSSTLNRQLMEGANLDSGPGLPEGIKNPLLSGGAALGEKASAFGERAVDLLDRHLPGRGESPAQLGPGGQVAMADAQAGDPAAELSVATEVPQLPAGQEVAAPPGTEAELDDTTPMAELGAGEEVKEGEIKEPLSDAELEELAPPLTSGPHRLLSRATAAARAGGGKSLEIARDLTVTPMVSELAGIGAEARAGLLPDADHPNAGLIGTLMGGGVLGTLTGTALIGGSNWSPGVSAAETALMHSRAVTRLGKFAGARRSSAIASSSAVVERWERTEQSRATAQAAWQQSEQNLRQVEARGTTVVREMTALAGRGPSALAAGPTRTAYIELRQIDRDLAGPAAAFSTEARASLLAARDRIATQNPDLLTRYEGERAARHNFVTIRRLERSIEHASDPAQSRVLSDRRRAILDANPEWAARYREVSSHASTVKAELASARTAARRTFVAYDTATAVPAFLPAARIGKAVRQGWAASAPLPAGTEMSPLPAGVTPGRGRLSQAIGAGAAELVGPGRLDHLTAARATRLERVSAGLGSQILQLSAGPSNPAKEAMLNDLSAKLARADAERAAIAAEAESRSMLAERARIRRLERRADLVEELDVARETVNGHGQTVRSLDWLREHTDRDVRKGRLTPDALARMDARLASARNEQTAAAVRVRALEDDISRLALAAATPHSADALDAAAVVARAAERGKRRTELATLEAAKAGARAVAAAAGAAGPSGAAGPQPGTAGPAQSGPKPSPEENPKEFADDDRSVAPLAPGMRVRHPGTGRPGVVTEVIAPTADGDWVYAVHFDDLPGSDTEDTLGRLLQKA